MPESQFFTPSQLEAVRFLRKIGEFTIDELAQTQPPAADLLASAVHGLYVPVGPFRPKLCEWIVRAQQSAFVNGDREGYLRWFAWDALLEDSSAPPVRGHAAIGGFYDGLLGMFKSVEFVSQEFDTYPKRVTDDAQWLRVRVAMKFAMAATLPDGKRLQVEGVDVFDFDAALWIERVTSFYRLPV